jgi:hypothetical protein
MATDDPSGPKTAPPIVLRIKLRYDDVEAMVQRFAANVGKSGLFLPTRSLQPVGAELKFELRLADDTPALVGFGRVKEATAPDPNRPKAAFGMAIELSRVTQQSRGLILQMLERRRALGLPELILPTAADIDAARQDAPGEPVPEPSEALLTAPRRPTGPIVVARTSPVPALVAEAPRKKRIPLSELIESASGPVAQLAVPGLDDDIDVAAAIARARALAEGSVDSDLEALAEAAATPIEISVEAASAELARQLGGSAVRRERSARWVTPPATTSVPAPAPAAPEPEPAPAAVKPGDSGEIHQLDDFDLEDATHTEMGGTPQSSVIDHAALAARLEAQLAQAEAEVDADELELASELALQDRTGAVIAPADDAVELSDGEDGEPHDLSLEEIDDFEILAEADAVDEELLAAAGEAGDLRLPSDVDFAARLDLGDESGRYFVEASELGADDELELPDPHADSAVHALAGFDGGEDAIDPDALDDADDNDFEPRSGVRPIFEPDSSSSVTLAGPPSDPLELEIEPPAPAPAPRAPEPRRANRPSLYDTPVQDHELEHALEALDVDLDDLAIPHAATELQRDLGAAKARAKSRSAPPAIGTGQEARPSQLTNRLPVVTPARAIRAPSTGRIVARPNTDDGVVIDFDEED